MSPRPLSTRLIREHVCINAFRIAKHDKANVAHVVVRHALDVRRSDGTQSVKKLRGLTPAAADEFGLRQLTSLRRVGFLAQVVTRQKLLPCGLDFFRADLLVLESCNFTEHQRH